MEEMSGLEKKWKQIYFNDIYLLLFLFTQAASKLDHVF